MDEIPGIKLVTLWFVVLIFLQTNGGSADGALMTAVGLIAVLLSYTIPVALVIRVALHLVDG